MWLFDLFFPHFCKSDMPRYGYLEVFQRVPWTSRQLVWTLLDICIPEQIRIRVHVLLGGIWLTEKNDPLSDSPATGKGFWWYNIIQRTTNSTIRPVWPAKTQIGMYIHPVWQWFSFIPILNSQEAMEGTLSCAGLYSENSWKMLSFEIC